jgi:hypothetical protein
LYSYTYVDNKKNKGERRKTTFFRTEMREREREREKEREKEANNTLFWCGFRRKERSMLPVLLKRQ